MVGRRAGRIALAFIFLAFGTSALMPDGADARMSALGATPLAAGMPPAIVLPDGCEVPGDVVAAADALLRNRYTLGTERTVRLPADPSWRENPFRDANWLFDYHSLRFVMKLEAAWAQTGNARYLARALFLLRDWLHDNPRPAPRSRFAWNDHATAWRAMVLACTARIVRSRPWLRAALWLHGTVLADPHFYVWHGNHALNQAIGLLDIGCVLRRAAWKRLAAGRIGRLVVESVDARGVSNEQSIGYELYDYRRYVAAEQRLRACGLGVPAAFARVDRMPTFLGWATLPNGEYELIGDTRVGRAAAIPGTLAEFAATGGTSGPRPAGTFASFAAGYAFGRSGWGDTRLFADETAFAVRYGRGRALHGHADGGSLTVYGFGSRLIVGSGTYSYNGGPFRSYFVGRSAQNVVTVGGVAYRAAATTPLRFQTETPDAVALGLDVRGYAGVRDQRMVVFSKTSGYLIVDDRLASSRPKTYTQLWHLAPSSRPTALGPVVRTHTPGGDVVIVQLGTRPRTTIVTGATHPIQGWRTYRYNHRLRAPTVEARLRGRSARYLTLIVPVRDDTDTVRVLSSSLRAYGYTVVVEINGHAEQVVLQGSSVAVTPLY